ncbi:MAG: hypothetical protein LBE85_09490 [Candidatus Accumulibacter sp.]|jgi:hypothetical protein|nr:hypothetical protein [Accumulibacter sp.]
MNRKTWLNQRTLAAAAALACLSPVSWGECVPSAVVRGADVTTISKTSTGECLKTEGHVGEEEVRGHTVTLSPDGSVNPQGQDSTFVFNKEVMRFDEKGGKKDYYGQFGGEWPDDEHTRRLPKPDMPLAFAGVNEKDRSFTATFVPDEGNRQRDVTRMKAYAEKLKARGFTIQPKESERPGAQGYSYRAKNSTGYLVRATCPAVPQVPCGLELFTPETVKKREAKGTL